MSWAKMDESNPTNSRVYKISDKSDLTIALVNAQNSDILKDATHIDRTILATIMAELGTNIIKYANRGELRVCRKENQRNVDIEIWAQDKGPGMPDIDLAMQDHYSTGGSLGLGLPGVKRMADEFWLRSSHQSGTLAFARKRIRGKSTGSETFKPYDSNINKLSSYQNIRRKVPYELGMTVRPCTGQLLSGDSIVKLETDQGILLAIVDATGHGKKAAEIAKKIEGIVMRYGRDLNLGSLMEVIHKELRGSLGAAVALLDIDLTRECFRYVAVGNIRAYKLGLNPWRGLSRDGVMGSRFPTPYEQFDKLESGDLLLLWTDGIPDLECLQHAKSFSFRSAPHIAKKLVQELGKSYDDAACMVFKCLR